MSILDSISRRETGGDRFFKFDVQGAQIAGVVTAVGLAWNYDQTEQVPELTLNTAGGEKVVTCSNTVLYNLAYDAVEAGTLVPGVHVTITHTGMAGRAKLFTMDLAAPMAPAVAAPAPVAPVLAVVPAPVPEPPAPAAATPPPVAPAPVAPATPTPPPLA